MREYPKNIKYFELKHKVLISDKNLLTSIENDIILRHDLAFLFLKRRIQKALSNYQVLVEDSFLEKVNLLEKKKSRKNIWEDISNAMPSNLSSLDKSGNYYLIIFMIFISQWIIVFLLSSIDDTLFAFSFLHPEVIGLISGVTAVITVGCGFLLGKLYKNKQIPSEYRDLTFEEFTGKIINNNRDIIKSNFKTIFSIDLEELKK